MNKRIRTTLTWLSYLGIVFLIWNALPVQLPSLGGTPAAAAKTR
jgi:hypothetical protein